MRMWLARCRILRPGTCARDSKKRRVHEMQTTTMTQLAPSGEDKAVSDIPCKIYRVYGVGPRREEAPLLLRRARSIGRGQSNKTFLNPLRADVKRTI
jgi:hypothetical protein